MEPQDQELHPDVLYLLREDRMLSAIRSTGHLDRVVVENYVREIDKRAVGVRKRSDREVLEILANYWVIKTSDGFYTSRGSLPEPTEGIIDDVPDNFQKYLRALEEEKK